MRLILFLCLFTVLSTGLTAQSVLEVADGHFGIDEEKQLIVVRADLTTDGVPEVIRTISLGERTFTFRDDTRVRYRRAYPVRTPEQTYELYFTRLPLLHIQSSEYVRDEPKVWSELRFAAEDQEVASLVGMEVRGGFSQQLPKQSYDLEFWADTLGDDKVDVSFGDLRSDDDWVLDGVYNEPSRVNAFVGQQLWLDIHRPYYARQEPEAKAGVNQLWCEFFFNGRYRGLYYLSEQIDRKLLKLKKTKDGEMRGELYKGDRPLIPGKLPPVPDTLTDIWNEYELKYPELEEADGWLNLFDLVEFFLVDPDERIRAEAAERLHMGNMVDYLLFLNIMAATDNTGKNLYIGRYDNNEPYFYTPWDLDATWGNNFDGFRDDIAIDSIITGIQHDRLLSTNAAGFNDMLCTRANELRESGLLTPDSLEARVRQQFDYLSDNGVYAREELIWPGSVEPGPDRLAYTLEWVRTRAELVPEWACGPTVRTDNEVADGAENFGPLSPNPTSGLLYLPSLFDQDALVRVYSITGRQMHAMKLGAGASSIDLSELNPGWYVVRIDDYVWRVVVN